MSTRPARISGFTLIEVMIAVVILGIGLSSLFTSQAGAIRVAQRARTTTVATLLARCKMGEVEEDLAKKGWPGTNLEGRDECCVGATHDGYRCEWKVERIVLPDASEAQTEAEAKDALQGGATGAPGSPAGPAPGMPPLGTPMGSPLSPTGGAAPVDPLQNFGIPVTGIPSATDMTGVGGSGGDPMAMMVMQYTFPIMKPIIEEQVRRLTVHVEWAEGTSIQGFDLVQFIVNEYPIVADTVDEENETPGQPASTGTQGTTGTGTGSQGTTGTGTSTGPGNTGTSGGRQ